MWKNTLTKLDRQRAILQGLVLLLVVLALVLGAYAYGRSQSLAGISEEDRESVELYAEALDAVKDDYVDQEAVDPEKQTYGAIEGMLGSLGDEGHTRFLTPEEVQDNRQGLSGKYVGVGIQLETKDEKAVVSAPIDGSPADGAGIKSGDVVIAVNGENVEGQDVSQIADKVRGPEGSEVALTIRRGEGPEAEEREFQLVREELELEAVSWAVIPDTTVAHLSLTSFSGGAAEQLKTAIEEAREAGATRFVLDLRDNAGGRVDEAMDVAGTFLDPDDVVYVRKDASGDEEETRVPGNAEPISSPVVVLTNGGTASSAEIVAGALRDNGRAKIVGVTTFGTGTVLAEQILSDGSAILLGIAEWLTPSGDFIRGSGIEPDVEARLEEDQEPLVSGQLEALSQEEVFVQDAQLRRAFEVVQDG